MSFTRGKGKSSGWSAFDLKQRQKQGLAREIGNDPFPPVAISLAALRPCTSQMNCNDLSVRSFSSVLKPSASFPTLKPNKDSIKSINVGKPIRNEDKMVGVNSNGLALKKLKEEHCWAENSLIEDILLATNNNVHEASALLKGMMPTSGTEDIEDTKNNEMRSTVSNFPVNEKAAEAEHVGQSSKTDGQEENRNMFTDVHENKLFDDHFNMKFILGQLASIPIEPEWEEDDVYLSHRKDAIKIMRSAAQHSKAATNAFFRGDHFAAQQHSQNAQEEWLAAQRLNAKAAREILSLRNSDKDLWKLDLHGLHAAEAVQAVHEHLRRLEILVSRGRSVSPNGVKANNGTVRSSSVGNISSMDKLGKPQTSSRQMPASLQVITGIGNHSRGQAALPAAVRGFLIENGYRFDETRPGLITVRPKFRRD